MSRMGEPLTHDVCDFSGHCWGDAGGDLEICMVCSAERWAGEHLLSPDCQCKDCLAYDESSPL